MAAEMRSPNVSVTPINVDHQSPYHHHLQSQPQQLFNGGPGGGSMHTTGSGAEPPDSGSDAEVAQIDFQSSRVMMRADKKTPSDIPRPMSWEGELSDGGAFYFFYL